MKPKHRIVVTLAMLTVAVTSLGLTYWCRKGDLALAESRPIADPLIITSKPVMRGFSRHVPWIGEVQSQASVRLTALVAGRVETIAAKDQVPIQKGAMVVRLGGSRIDMQHAQLQARIKSLKSQLDLAHQTMERLEQNMKDQLVTRDQVAIAQDAQIKLQARLYDAQLAMESFDEQIHIVAPMAGIFTNRRVSPGQTVRVGDVVGEIIDRDHLRIAASLSPPERIRLEGKKVSIRIDGTQALTGIVRHVLPEGGSTGATTVWIESSQINKHLYPGQTVSGEVMVEITPLALAVPKSAMVYDSQEHPYIFIQKDGIYKLVSVRLGLTQNGWVEVLSGLEQNQSVVTQGAYELFYHRFNEQFKVKD